MEVLITFIVFLIIFWKILSFIRRVFLPTPKEGEKEGKEKPKWRRTLEDLMERIQQEMEVQKARQRGEETSWEDLFGSEFPEEDVPGKPKKAPPPPPVPERPQKAEGVPKTPSGRGAVPVPEASRPYPTTEPGRERGPRTVRELRRAVVWSEILGTPVGLREK